jgi:glutamate/tyrosine decarboxylase-like PLP-dependent enzyme
MARTTEDPARVEAAVLDAAVAHARRWLGTDGVRALVEGLVRAVRGLAEGIGAIPGAVVLDDVVYTQVSVAFESDERTREVFDRLVAEGMVMPSAGVWHGRTVIRFSVSSWRTGEQEVRDTVAAVARAARVPTRRPTAVGE